MNYYFITTKTQDGMREYYANWPMAAHLEKADAEQLARQFVEQYNDDEEAE